MKKTLSCDTPSVRGPERLGDVALRYFGAEDVELELPQHEPHEPIDLSDVAKLLDERLADLDEANPDEGSPWPEVKRRILESLEERKKGGSRTAPTAPDR